jgi:hypothetical protein
MLKADRRQPLGYEILTQSSRNVFPNVRPVNFGYRFESDPQYCWCYLDHLKALHSWRLLNHCAKR